MSKKLFGLGALTVSMAVWWTPVFSANAAPIVNQSPSTVASPTPTTMIVTVTVTQGQINANPAITSTIRVFQM